MPNGTINATFNANCAKIYNLSKIASDGEKVVSLQGYDEVEKALGLYWCLVKDEFFVKLELSDVDGELLEQLGGNPSTSSGQLPREMKPKLTLSQSWLSVMSMQS